MTKEEAKKLAEEGYLTDVTVFAVPEEKLADVDPVDYKLVTQVAKAVEMKAASKEPEKEVKPAPAKPEAVKPEVPKAPAKTEPVPAKATPKAPASKPAPKAVESK